MLARRRFPRLRPNAIEVRVSVLIELGLGDNRVHILDGEEVGEGRSRSWRNRLLKRRTRLSPSNCPRNGCPPVRTYARSTASGLYSSGKSSRRPPPGCAPAESRPFLPGACLRNCPSSMTRPESRARQRSPIEARGAFLEGMQTHERHD